MADAFSRILLIFVGAPSGFDSELSDTYLKANLWPRWNGQNNNELTIAPAELQEEVQLYVAELAGRS